MLIVSRIKNRVINIDNIESIDVNANNVIRVFPICNNDEFYELGKYETEMKAKKTLTEIISAYANNERVFFMPEE